MPPPRIDAPLGAEMDRWVGSRVRMARQGKNISMVTLGDRIGVGRQQIEKWERGLQRLTTGQLHVISGALGIHPGWFFDDFPIGGAVPQNGAADVDLVLKMPDAMPLLMAFARLRRDERGAVTLLLQSIGANRAPTVDGEEPDEG